MKKRISIIVSDSILLVFLGLVYAWSVFKKPLAAAYGWNDSQLTWTFTICMFLFCLGGFAGAQISKKIPHRIVTWGCGILIGLSFVLLGFMTSLWQLYVLYGGVIGFTVGVVYNCVLATGNKWYPDKGGLIAGLLLMFYGAGSLVLSPVSNALMANFGLQKAFIILGVLFAVAVFLTGFSVRPPKDDELNIINSLSEKSKVNSESKAPEKKQYTPSEMMKTKNFWIYFIWCIMVSAIGIGVVGQIFTMSLKLNLPDATCALMVSLFAVFNGLGRFIFGGFYDKRGRLLTMTIFGVLFTLGGFCLLLGVKLLSPVLFVLSLALLGVAYGGVTPTNANFARSFFGTKHYATNFSLVNFNLLAAVFLGQFIGSTLYMQSGNYINSAIAITIISAVSLILQFFIKEEK